jgi:pimeloyl-ACP methyl ester carboxylesterase
MEKPAHPVGELVILVHGFLGSRLQMLPLASVLSARGYNIINFGYASRKHCLADHAHDLADTVCHRLANMSPSPSAVHYVTHSFGSVVLLHAAAKLGLPQADMPSRRVLIAPPARGSVLARRCHDGDLPGFSAPKSLLPAMRYAASVVLGPASGKQLGSMTADWFLDQVSAEMMETTETLVVCGNVGQRVNSFIGSDNDGVVAVSETVLPYPHHRSEHNLTHNLLLFSPSVFDVVTSYLTDGRKCSNIALCIPRKEGCLSLFPRKELRGDLPS